MKLAVVLAALLVCVPIAGQPELPFTETVTIESADDQYSLDVAVPVYVKRGSTYEIEDQLVKVRIGPKDWVRTGEGEKIYEFKDRFFKVYVLIVLSNMNEKISEDFESYLNCKPEDCNTISFESQLFWDHAGEKRADKAGEFFDIKTPLVVSDAYIEVTFQVLSYYVKKNSIYSI